MTDVLQKHKVLAPSLGFGIISIFFGSIFLQAEETSDNISAQNASYETAIFAGGCFWCTESDFEKVPGVVEGISGYVGGKKERPTYRQVSSGGTKHTEAVKVIYDPTKVNYETLLEVFWYSIDPLAKDRQFCDKGKQYRSGIFYLNESQRQLAEKSKTVLANSGVLSGPIQTEITEATPFWEAEEYHQDYYKKNPIRYNWYRGGCGRDERLKTLWGDKANWKPKATSGKPR